MDKINFERVNIRLASEKDLYEIVNLLADDQLGSTRETKIQDGKVNNKYLTAYYRIKSDPNHMLVVMEYEKEIIGTLQLIIIPTLTLT